MDEVHEAILASIPSLVFIFDKDQRVKMANRSFPESRRSSPTDLSPTPLRDFFPEVFRRHAHLEDLILQVFETRRPVYGGKLTYRAAGRHARVYTLKFVPVHNDSGGVGNVLLVMDDITEQEGLGAEIRKVERHIASVVESASDLVISLDSEGKIFTWNTAASKVTGRSAEEMMGRHLTDMPGADRAETENVLRLLQSGSTIRDRSLNLRNRDGARLEISWSWSPIRSQDGTVGGFVGVGRDLTERKALEAQLVQTEKMVSLGAMAGGIAHEIRNPLGISASAAQLLLENPSDERFRKECLKRIDSGIQRASRIIEALLRFARPPSEGMSAQVNINPVIKDAIDLARHALSERLQITTRMQSGLPGIRGNPDLLQQVFLNLILNADNAVEGKGRLRISTRTCDERTVEAKFADSGRGIPEDVRGKIFDPFYTTMPFGKGSGLGLTVCYGIVKHHGGEILLDSEPDKGSSFTVRLPVDGVAVAAGG